MLVGNLKMEDYGFDGPDTHLYHHEGPDGWTFRYELHVGGRPSISVLDDEGYVKKKHEVDGAEHAADVFGFFREHW